MRVPLVVGIVLVVFAAACGAAGLSESDRNSVVAIARGGCGDFDSLEAHIDSALAESSERGLPSGDELTDYVARQVRVQCDYLEDGSPAPTTTAPEHEQRCPGSARLVTYLVDGSASSASLTMARGDGTEQVEVSLPLRNSSGTDGVSQCSAAGEFAYVSAQNLGESGSVTCTIMVDGVEFASNTSSGAFVIATCDGSVP